MRSITSIAGDVAARIVSSEEVAREALARLEDYDRIQPEAWISRCPPADVLLHARRVDARLAAGEHLPLAGVPFAVKDNIDVAGMQTTAACPAFAYLAQESAHVIHRLTDAGAILIGKTNLDQFATGLAGTRSPYGVPRCVFNREYVSGGSSSGSAVVVGAGVVPLGLGTDTAGSGRVPAAFNGLAGFKPTRGRWSTRGLVPACRSLDCISSFTRNAADAAVVDAVLTAFDAADPYSRLGPPEPQKLDAALRVGVPRTHQLEFFGDAESATLFTVACERVAQAGGSAVEIDIEPLLAAARLLYAGPWLAERTSGLESLLESDPGAIHPVVRSLLQAGRGILATEAFRGFDRLKSHARAAEAIWRAVDVLLLPTAPTIYRVSEMLAEPIALNSNLGLYTNFVNLLDMCAIAVPAGFRRNDTGFGVSLIGPAWTDRVLLEVARQLESVLPAWETPLLDTADRPASVRLAVVGAHLSGMPLHWQLAVRSARLVARTRTAPLYRLYAMAGQSPPRPALVHVGAEGAGIELEVYELELAAFGSFVAEVLPPLAIGTVVLEDGSPVCGFLAEPRALTGAHDITSYRGWRGYCARRECESGRSPAFTCAAGGASC